MIFDLLVPRYSSIDITCDQMESTAESALPRGQAQLDASRRGKTGLASSRDKAHTVSSEEGGEEPAS